MLRYPEPNNKVRRLTFIKKCKKWVKFNTLLRFITTLPIHIMTTLIMQFLRLNETFRMIGHSILWNNVNFVEIGFSGYDEKTGFWVF